jgi:hypothetical protein
LGIIVAFFASLWFRLWRLLDAAMCFTSSTTSQFVEPCGDLISAFPVLGIYITLVARNTAPIAAALRLTPRPPMFGAFSRPPGMGLLTWNIGLNERFKDVSLAAAAWAVASLPLSARAFACLYGASPWRWLLLPLHLLAITLALPGLLALYASLLIWSLLRRSDLAAVLRLLGALHACRQCCLPAACPQPEPPQNHPNIDEPALLSRWKPIAPADVPLMVLCGLAASIVADEGPQVGRYVPLVKAYRVLPVLLLNIVVSSLALLLLAAMRLSARRSRPATAAAVAPHAPRSVPSTAYLCLRFTDREILAIVSLMNFPLALACIRVYFFILFNPLQAPNDKEQTASRRKCCTFLAFLSILPLVLGLLIGLRA